MRYLVITVARPEEYTPEIAATLCARISTGMSLRSVCEMEDMPCTSTFYFWLPKHPTLSEQYAHAKQCSADSDADKLDRMAEEVLEPDGIEPQRVKVAADIMKWSMSKKQPKKYGDKIQQEVSGSLNVNSMSDEELQAIIARGKS